MIKTASVPFGKERGVVVLTEPTTAQIRAVIHALNLGDLVGLTLDSLFGEHYAAFIEHLKPFVRLPDGLDFDDLSESEWLMIYEEGRKISPFAARTADMLMTVSTMTPDTLAALERLGEILKPTVSDSPPPTP